MNRSSLPRFLLLPAVAGLALGAAGCSTSGGSSRQSAPTTSTTEVSSSSAPGSSGSAGSIATTTAPAGAADDQALLKSVSAQPGDLRTGEQVTLYEDGDKIVDQVSLDYCGFEFQTEQYRVARRQVAVGEAESTSGSSVEAIRYRHGEASAALAEYAAAVKQCPPDQFQTSTVDGVPDFRYSSQPIPNPQAPGLLPNHLAIVATATPKSGAPMPNTIVLQQRGDVLMTTYGDDEARTIALATAVGQHLAALPADQIGA